MKRGERLKIEGPPEALKQLREEIHEAAGDEVEIDPVSTAVPGQLREPVLVGLVVSVQTGAAMGSVAMVILRFIKHLEHREQIQLTRELENRKIDVAELQLEESD